MLNKTDIETLKEAAACLKQYIDDIGCCDHAVNICCCHEIRVAEKLNSVIQNNEA